MIKCFCVVCGAYIGEFFPSQIRRTCSKECYSKLISNQVKGEKNPNYRHGKYIENRCKNCGKLIDPRSTFCHKCRPGRGGGTGMRGYRHSEETKKIIGEKSKQKWKSKEYREKIKAKHNGKRKRSINGYILIKDYNHPNRNSHNDVLEHVYVMSNHLDRPIAKGEIVHHIDGDRTNNDISNLYLYKNRSKHLKGHNSLLKLTKELLQMGIIKFERGKYMINKNTGGDIK